MDLAKAYAVNDDLAVNGRWLVTRAGMEVKVAKAGNQEFINEVVRLQKPHIHLLNSAADTSDLLDEITNEAMAKTILKDWKAEVDGAPVPYTWEDGKMALMEYSDFREDISALSDNRNNYKATIAEK